MVIVNDLKAFLMKKSYYRVCWILFQHFQSASVVSEDISNYIVADDFEGDEEENLESVNEEEESKIPIFDLFENKLFSTLDSDNLNIQEAKDISLIFKNKDSFIIFLSVFCCVPFKN